MRGSVLAVAVSLPARGVRPEFGSPSMSGTRPARGARRERGAAIVTALLVVILATVVVAGLFVRENVTVRTVENRLALSQTRWIERAGLDWAKVILRSDTNNVDHLGEPWATPVAETRLDETVTAGAKIGDSARPAMLAGQVVDAQSRFNLNSIVQGGNVANEHLLAFRRLLTVLGQPESVADLVVARLLRSTSRTFEGKVVAPAELPLLRIDDLRTIAGVDPATVEALRPFAIVLPVPTQVNINTAPAEVLAAMIPDADIGSARRFVARRERTYFQNLGQAQAQIDGQPALQPTLFSVASGYFIVRGMVRFDRVEASSETLLERSAQRVDIVWQQRY